MQTGNFGRLIFFLALPEESFLFLPGKAIVSPLGNFLKDGVYPGLMFILHLIVLILIDRLFVSDLELFAWLEEGGKKIYCPVDSSPQVMSLSQINCIDVSEQCTAYVGQFASGIN
jgi:hypothetical protein